jgi:hypothetical protein
MDSVFGSRTGHEDAVMLEQARRDVGIHYAGGDAHSVHVAEAEKDTSSKTASEMA